MKAILLIMCLGFSVANAQQLKSVSYNENSQKLIGYSIAPKTEKAPGVLILPAWKGIDDHVKQVATEISKLGYYAFIADIYGVGNYPADAKQAGEKSGYYKKNFEQYQNRIQSALDQLIKSGADADNIVVIGYCFGGTGALEAARGVLPVSGVVSIHGGLGKDTARPNNKVSPKVLVLHGADDPYVPQKDIDAFQTEMREGNADWQMIYYSNAVHAFTEKAAGNDNSKGAAYNELADKRSWEHLKLFLREVFKK